MLPLKSERPSLLQRDNAKNQQDVVRQVSIPANEEFEVAAAGEQIVVMKI